MSPRVLPKSFDTERMMCDLFDVKVEGVGTGRAGEAGTRTCSLLCCARRSRRSLLNLLEVPHEGLFCLGSAGGSAGDEGEPEVGETTRIRERIALRKSWEEGMMIMWMVGLVVGQATEIVVVCSKARRWGGVG